MEPAVQSAVGAHRSTTGALRAIACSLFRKMANEKTKPRNVQQFLGNEISLKMTPLAFRTSFASACDRAASILRSATAEELV
jgi:hypothetical protein